MPRILVLHGPNLNALGAREPDRYGSTTLDQLHRSLEDLAKELGCELETFQTNAEGVLIDALYRAVGRVDGVLLNPGGLTHTSVALRDAVAATALPVVEVHLTQPQTREAFRKASMISEVAIGLVQGFGADSYRLGLRALAAWIARGRQA